MAAEREMEVDSSQLRADTTLDSQNYAVSSPHPSHIDQNGGAKTAPAPVQVGMASSNVVELSKGNCIDRFQRLDQLLGKGANKEVYLAFDTEKNCDVAWNRIPRQRLSEKDAQVFMKEVEMMDRCDHKFVIKYLDRWETDNYFVFITEFFHMSLKQFIQERNVMINSVKTWTSQILEGLIHLHSLSIIHRDIKCDNVFINQKTGNVVIGDLGLSTYSEATKASMSMVGTVPFMAPEQLDLHQRQYGPKVDIYALGMTVLEMTSGKYPFEECNGLQYIIKNIIDDNPPENLARLREGSTKNFILRCLTRDPLERPSASQLKLHTWFTHLKDNHPVASLLLPTQNTTPTVATTQTATEYPEDVNLGALTEDEVVEDSKEPELPIDSEKVEFEKFAQSITTMKTLTTAVKDATRSLLPRDVQNRMSQVDDIVDTFIAGSSALQRQNFHEDAVKVLSEWEELRGKFNEWSKGKEEERDKHVVSITEQENVLSEEKKKIEEFNQQEIEIRREINTAHTSSGGLEERMRKIDEELQKLQEQRREIEEQHQQSSQAKTDLEKRLQEVLSGRETAEEGVHREDAKLQDILSSGLHQSESKQLVQFGTWKESVEKVMNEIQKARELEWKKWGPDNIVDWICRLDHGAFKPYRQKLEVEAPSKLDTGEDLLFLLTDRQTIGELGIAKIRHREALIKHIERLNRNSPSTIKPDEKAENPGV